MGVDIYWRGWDQGIHFNVCAIGPGCQGFVVPKSLTVFSAGEVIHIAVAWDLNGIDGTADTLRAYFNGQLVAKSSPQWPRTAAFGGFQWGNTDYTQYATIDNMVVYDFAKIDYSDRFSENPVPTCEGVSPKLSALIGSKTGTQDARTWAVTVSNKSYCPGQNAQIDNLKLTQTYGVACTPVITSPTAFPLALGDIAANGKASGPVTINFSACPSTARFTAKITYSANDGAVKGAKILNNQFR